jgi:hypothetical protein
MLFRHFRHASSAPGIGARDLGAPSNDIHYETAEDNAARASRSGNFAMRKKEERWSFRTPITA